MIQGAIPPDNAGYYHAAYAAALGIYALYAVSIWRRRRALRERHVAEDRDAQGGDSGLGTRE